jgi:hypothetical protein
MYIIIYISIHFKCMYVYMYESVLYIDWSISCLHTHTHTQRTRNPLTVIQTILQLPEEEYTWFTGWMNLVKSAVYVYTGMVDEVTLLFVPLRTFSILYLSWSLIFDSGSFSSSSSSFSWFSANSEMPSQTWSSLVSPWSIWPWCHKYLHMILRYTERIALHGPIFCL